jgi:hypothetical protein
MDVGVHGAVIRDRDGHRGTTGRDPNSISKEGESVFAPNTPTKAELDPSMQLSPQSPSASQRQVEFRPQQTRSTVLTSSLGQRNARRQAWYQLSPHMRKHSQSAVLNESGASFPASQTLLPQYSPLDARANISHSESHLLSGSASPSDLLIRSQSQGHVPVSGPIFRSGTLQIGPAMNAASQQAVAREGQILEDGIKDDVMDICHSPSLAQARGRSNSRIETRSQLSQYQSQSLSSTGDSSFESHSSPFEYQFLTQAPCQSQSLSQS